MADQVKIAFFDIDGTMIDIHTKKPTDTMLAALRQLQEKGVAIVIATGRAASIIPDFPGVSFDSYLTFNGSYCFMPDGTEIFSNPIPTHAVQRVMANAAAMGRPVSIATARQVLANGVDADLADFFAIGKVDVPVVDNLDEIVASEPVYQLQVGGSAEEYVALVEGVPEARVVAWWDRAADVIPSNGGKGRGVLEILAAYGLSPDQAIAFGDGRNDIEMLQTVGWGVAMGNAKPVVKEAADDVCGDVADDGIYHYLRAHGVL